MAFEQSIDRGNAELRELALFAGAGGGILGGKLLGWRTVCAVEIEDYCRQVLAQRQNDGILHPFPVWDDVRTFDGSPWAGRVDIITGGFPCQDISAAGKGAGIDGKRSGLWREMARIIREVGPRHVLVENSPILTSRGLGTVLGDLAAMGYDAQWGVLGAHHAGAPHKRDRIWILAHRADPSRLDCRPAAALADTDRRQFREPEERQGELSRGTEVERPGEDVSNAPSIRQPTTRHQSQHGKAASNGQTDQLGGGDKVANADSEGQLQSSGTVSQGRRRTCNSRQPLIMGHATGIRWNEGSTTTSGSRSGTIDWWITEPDVGRVAHGVAARVDRLKAIGNGQVPAVAALAWLVINQQLATTENSQT